MGLEVTTNRRSKALPMEFTTKPEAQRKGRLCTLLNKRSLVQFPLLCCGLLQGHQ